MNVQKIREHPFWTLFGVFLALFLAYFIYQFIGTFVLGVFFYYVSRPFHRRLIQYIPYRGIAAGISLIVVTLPLLLLISAITLAALREYRLFDQRYDITSQLEPYLDPFIDISAATSGNLSSLSTSTDAIQNTLAVMIQYLSIFGIGATHFLLMIIIAFYLLRDDHRLGNWLRAFDNDAGYLNHYMNIVDQDLHHIFFGNILNAVFAGTIASIVYLGLNSISPTTLQIPYPILLGALVGVASLIPIVGMKLAYVPVAGYLYAMAFLSAGTPMYWFPTLFLISSFILIDGIPDFILRPYVSGKNTHIGMLMGAYILGPFMFGWYGIFLAPLLLVFTLQYSRLILPELTEIDTLKLIDTDNSTLQSTEPQTTDTTNNTDSSAPSSETTTTMPGDADTNEQINVDVDVDADGNKTTPTGDPHSTDE